MKKLYRKLQNFLSRALDTSSGGESYFIVIDGQTMEISRLDYLDRVKTEKPIPPAGQD